VSALAQNTSLLQLDFRFEHGVMGVSERAFLALAESLPEMNVLQRVDLSWCPGLASAGRIAQEHELISFSRRRL
jgi:hypothetical protein